MPTPGRSTLMVDQADDQRDGGDDLEVDEGLDRDAPDLAQIAHAGDAVRDRAEDDQPDHHLDQVDEDVAQRVEAFAPMSGANAPTATPRAMPTST